MILVLDFGSQYTQLISRRVRELQVYCEIHPYHYRPENTDSVRGVILSGSPFSVRDPQGPKADLSWCIGKIPVLGICYGAQLITMMNGGEVMQSSTREYGRANLSDIVPGERLFKGIEPGSQVWMSHADTIVRLSDDHHLIARTNDIGVAAFRSGDKDVFGLQFHPEVYHTSQGEQLLKNFVADICGCSQNWTPESFIQNTVKYLQETIGNEKVVLGLSGGVDSSVAATLLNDAIGAQLYCIFVDNGLLRKNEFEDVLLSYKDMGLNVRGVRAADHFLRALEGITAPEEKRKAIGRVFIEVFEREANKLKEVQWLAQGTIYPDVIESVSVKGPSATIKSHHNVGGLPEKMNLKVVEPLNALFKDEVRRVGRSLGISSIILDRHPFPGPGLGIRIIGEVTADKVRALQEVDHIFVQGLKSSGWYDKVWQAAAILLPVQSVGVMGDERTYENTVVLRAVESTDGMTADWVHLPYELLARLSNDIINNVKGVNRVVYDISSKPPATIEWE